METLHTAEPEGPAETAGSEVAPMTLLWTQEDYDKGWCSSWHVGEPVDPGVWSGRDYLEGRCSAADIEKPKLVSVTPTAFADPGPHPVDLQRKLNLVREGLLNWINNHAGGAEGFFKANPGAGVKVLVRMMGGVVPVTQINNIDVQVSWLSKDRLSYKKDNVVDVSPLVRTDLVDDLQGG